MTAGVRTPESIPHEDPADGAAIKEFLECFTGLDIRQVRIPPEHGTREPKMAAVLEAVVQMRCARATEVPASARTDTAIRCFRPSGNPPELPRTGRKGRIPAMNIATARRLHTPDEVMSGVFCDLIMALRCLWWEFRPDRAGGRAADHPHQPP